MPQVDILTSLNHFLQLHHLTHLFFFIFFLRISIFFQPRNSVEEFLTSSIIISYRCATPFSLSYNRKFQYGGDMDSDSDALTSELMSGRSLTTETWGWAAELQQAAGAAGLPALLSCSLYYFLCSFYEVSTNLENTASAAPVFGVWIVEDIEFIALTCSQKCS